MMLSVGRECASHMESNKLAAVMRENKWEDRFEINIKNNKFFYSLKPSPKGFKINIYSENNNFTVWILNKVTSETWCSKKITSWDDAMSISYAKYLELKD